MKKKNSKKHSKKAKFNLQKSYYTMVIIAFLYLLIACMYKYIVYNSLGKCLLEIILTLVLSLLVQYVNVTDNGKKRIQIRGSLSKKTKLQDRVKLYFGESSILSLSITVIIFLAIAFNKIYINFYDFYVLNIAFTIVMCAFFSYLVFLVIGFAGNYYLSEKMLKKR